MDSTSPWWKRVRVATRDIQGQTYLQDEEPIVVQIDSTTLQQGLYLAVTACLTIDGVFATVVLVCCTRHDELRVRNDLRRVRPRLWLVSDAS